MVPQMKVMAVMVPGALAGQIMAALAATVAAAMLAAGEGIGCGDKRDGRQCQRGNGGCKDLGHDFFCF
jgi:hypothetical protein